MKIFLFQGKICVVCVHGGGRDRRAFLRHIPLFVKRGIPVLLFDFREHGTRFSFDYFSERGGKGHCNDSLFSVMEPERGSHMV